jgi:hypothetical protein
MFFQRGSSILVAGGPALAEHRDMVTVVHALVPFLCHITV